MNRYNQSQIVEDHHRPLQQSLSEGFHFGIDPKSAQTRFQAFYVALITVLSRLELTPGNQTIGQLAIL